MQPYATTNMPEPDATSAEHSRRVARHIRDRIANAGGCISFAEYMHEALYAPQLGYYSAGSRKFGPAGDFVTAPEVSPLFANVVARQCADLLRASDSASILEVGAGSGRMAADLLRKLGELGATPRRYRILEVSADLRDRQAALLAAEIPEHMERICWLDRLPDEHRGVIIANEVLDAMPVERFVRRAGHVAQLCVALQKDDFTLMEREAPDVLVRAVTAIERDLGRQLPDGYTSEVCLAAPAWIGDLGACLRQGMALLFDYGANRRDYYAEHRDGGWLRCHFRHRAHNDPLILPGIQDITSWVDFTAVATAALQHGFDVAGFVTQAHFLLNGGLTDELQEFTELPTATQLELSGQVKLLTLPDEMGERFKCLGLCRGDVSLPTSFRTADRMLTL